MSSHRIDNQQEVVQGRPFSHSMLYNTPIRMSDARWAALEESKRNVPRYLFRAFGEYSGGGESGLNSKRAIIPHLFLDGSAHQSIRDVPNLGDMVQGHLQNDLIRTEFSSWTPSMGLVLSYAAEKVKGHVCVLDRLLLPRVSIYNVPDLVELLSDKISTTNTYPEEYLAHGIVGGHGFKAISARKLRGLGLYSGLPELALVDWYMSGDPSWLDLPESPLNIEDVRRMKGVAEEFGPKFIVIMTAAFLSVPRRRRVKDTNKLWPDDVQSFRAGLDVRTICDFEALSDMFTYVVPTQGFPCIAQMMDLLEGLINLEAAS